MIIVSRVDASKQIGKGHLTRCLALSEALWAQNNVQIYFIGRSNEVMKQTLFKYSNIQFIGLPGNQEDQKHDATLTQEAIKHIPGKPDLLIVDHYDLDETWHKLLRPFVKKIMVIDDLANRSYDCDILLDQTFGRKTVDYESLVPKDAQLLLGNAFILLHPSFKQARQKALIGRPKRNKIERIFVSFGAMDSHQLCLITLEALQQLQINAYIDIMISSQASHVDRIISYRSSFGSQLNVHVDTDQVAELMLNADLAIGAGGVSTWERCCVGLPSLVAIIANNQKRIVSALEGYEAIINLGEINKNFDAVMKKINATYKDQALLKKMTQKAFDVCDGEGAYRAAKSILKS